MNIFEKLSEQNREREVEKNNATNFTLYDFEEIKWLALGKNKENQKVFRILGFPIDPVCYEVDRKNATDTKIILQSKIVNDKGKHSIINWPCYFNEKKNIFMPKEDFIFEKLRQKVEEGSWVNYKDEDINGEDVIRGQDGRPINSKTKKGGYWNNINKDTQCFTRIKENRKTNEKYPARFYPSTRVIMQIIDRQDDWCIKEKHTKLLSSSIREWTPPSKDGKPVDPIRFIDNGIPFTTYLQIINHYGESGRDWGITDCMLYKQKLGDAPLIYVIHDAKELDYFSEASKQIAIDDISSKPDQYKDFELYDLDTLYPDSKASKLVRNFSALFTQVDAELNTNFTQELKELERIEKEEDQKKEKKENSTTHLINNITPASTESEAKVESEKVESPTSRKPMEEKPEVTNKENKDLFTISFPKWEELTEAEKQTMKDGIKGFENGIPEYDVSKVTAYGCVNPECKFIGTDQITSYPGKVKTCPVCGAKDESQSS